MSLIFWSIGLTEMRFGILIIYGRPPVHSCISHLMIRIKYSTGEIDFSGFSSDYRKLRDQIVEFVSSSEEVFSIAVDSNYDPSPYNYSFKQLFFQSFWVRV